MVTNFVKQFLRNHLGKNQPTPNTAYQYGDVWSYAAKNLDLVHHNHQEEAAFQEAISLGYFSQYTSYRQKKLIENVVDWQIKMLEKWLGSELEHLPSTLNELSIIPELLHVERFSRQLSPDLLRNLWYMLFLNQFISPETQLNHFLEIGSGYGSFARIVKTYHPEATIWLADLPESLIYAQTYLKSAFPESKLLQVNHPDIEIPSDTTYDFILVSINEADRLFNRHFDLAVNIWSLGEMPNTWVNYWFDLIQQHSRVDRFYSLNAFSSPVTPQTTDRTKQGDWFMQLDTSWKVRDFQIDPEIHRCPFIRNFYTGLSIYGERMQEPHELLLAQTQAKTQVDDVFLEDWASIVINKHDIVAFDRPETNVLNILSQSELDFFLTVSLEKLLVITEYIGYPRLESHLDSTFFKLWNNFRLNDCLESGALLVCYLAFTNKSDLARMCSKEELFILKRLPGTLLHSEYHQFSPKASLRNENIVRKDLAGVEPA